MEIKIKNALLDAPPYTKDEYALNFIYPALLDFKKLRTSVSVASNIVKSIKEIERAVKEFHDIRTSICISLCEQNEKGEPKIENGQFIFNDENGKDVKDKLSELLNTEITINIFPVKNSDISSVQNVNILAYETLLKYGFVHE